MSEMSEMSAPAERPTDHQHPLAALSGHRPAHVLACWGLASLLPGATLHFEGDWAVPVLTWDGDAEALAQVAAEALVAGTWDLESRMPQELQALKPKEYQTTTPSRTVANALSRAAWEACRESAVLAGSGIVQTYDLSASSGPVKEPDVRVRSAALTLLSGTSYTAKSVQDTWALLGAETREAARDAAAVEIARLLDGRLAVAEAKPGLRFSAAQPTPRLTSGSEKCDVHPLIDLLAFCGQLLLQPAQQAMSGSRKVFTWVLNPVPLTVTTIVDLHESPPAHLPWPRWSSAIQSTEGSARITFLAPARQETAADVRGGSRA